MHALVSVNAAADVLDVAHSSMRMKGLKNNYLSSSLHNPHEKEIREKELEARVPPDSREKEKKKN